MTDLRRRAFLRTAAVLLATAATLTGCATLDTAKALITNQVSFDAEDLQAYLDRQYPRQYDQLGGLIKLNVLDPQVAIPEHGNRLHLDFDVSLEGLGLRGDRPTGHIALTSGLRFDPDTDALYMDEPRLETAELPVVGTRMNATGRDLINGWLRDYARNEPVYRLDADAREQLGNRRIAGTLIQDGKVVIKLDR